MPDPKTPRVLSLSVLGSFLEVFLRTLVAYVLVRQAGFEVSEVAVYLGRDATNISSLVSRFAEKTESDLEMQKQARKLAQIV